MGFFKSFFYSSPEKPESTEPAGQASAEVERIRFETLRDNGVRAMRMREMRMAAGYLEKALELRPDDHQTEAFLAEAYLRGGRPADALPILQEIAVREPKNVQAFISLAQAELDLEKWEDLRKTASSLQEIAGDDAVTYFFAGMACYHLPDLMKEAEGFFSHAVSLAGDYDAAREMRARALMAMGDYEAAESEIDYLASHQRAGDAAYLIKADIRRHFGDNRGALDACGNALAQNPFCSDAYLKQVEVYRSMGDASAALEVCRTALADMPADEGLLRAEAELTGNKVEIPVGDASSNDADATQKHADGQEFTQMENRVEDNIRKSNPFGF